MDHTEIRAGRPFLIPPCISDVEPFMTSIRRELHANPELSFKEHATASRIACILREMPGISHIAEGVGRTGVTAMIFGGAGKGPCILLRADMDALPLQETGDLPFKSKNEGVMHACGHDGHCAALLGAARVLAAERENMFGSIKLCFQPAEEGFGGARFMIADGILEMSADVGGEGPTPKVDEVYGAHLWTYEPLGTVGARAGPMMAGSDRFEVTVTGRGGHGAAPQSTVDAIVVASHVITALQTVVSRSIDPLEPAVVSCCQVHGGSGYNIISDSVKIGGTARHFSLKTQAVIESRMAGICNGVGAAFGADVTLDYHHGYPPTINTDARSLKKVSDAAAAVVGRENIKTDVQTCGAEDFSYFLQLRPGTFFFVGAALPGEQLRPHHRSDFDFDERALGITASVWYNLIQDILVA